MNPNDLYGLPLDRFVPERDALVKALRKEGRRDDAAEVAALRKPSVAAWAVNQMIRTQRNAVADLFETGDALQRAHSQLLAGRGDGNALREALAREREAVSELAEKARGLLDSEGHELTQTMFDRVSETLHAAALDPDARAQAVDGCLQRELRHIGVGGGVGPSAPPARGPRQTRARDERKEGAAGGARKARERAKQLEAARKAEGQARRQAERAARELERAVERRDRAAEELRDADSAVMSARERAEEAVGAHRTAQRALEQG
jgi:hypothetical protein